MKRVALALAAVLLAVPAVAFGAGMHSHDSGAAPGDVSIQYAAFAPARIDVLVGDTVRWSNDSVRTHTVTAEDGSWSSGNVAAGDMFQQHFAAPGVTSYYCKLHTSMRGIVEAHAILLTAPIEPTAPDQPFTLRGRAATTAGDTVTIEANDGAGFVPVTSANVGEDGGFAAVVTPRATTSYRATINAVASEPVQLLVLNRTLSAAARTRGRRVTVSATVQPASPGATVVLQLRLRHRFGWWPVARARLDHHSRARFSLRLHQRVPARVVLTLRDGATVLATSRTLRVGRR